MKKLFTALSIATAFWANAQIVTPDASFGSGGEFKSTFVQNGQSVINSEIQADGKIIFTGGSPEYQNFIGRLNADGTLDTTFGTNGYYTGTQVADGDYADILLDGTNIIVYYRESGTFIKLNSNGQLDSSFGSNGTLVLSNGTSNVLLIQDNLYTIENNNLVKINLQGTIVSKTPIKSFGYTPDIYNGPNNQIMVYGWNSSELKSFLSVYSTDAVINSSFGTNGTLLLDTYTDLTEFERSYQDFTVDTSGNIYNAHSNDVTFTATVRKYSSNGVQDLSFATNGVYTIKNSSLTSIEVLDNNIYVGGGEITNGSSVNTLIASITTSGQTNTAFTPTGVYVYNTNSVGEYSQSLNVLSATSFITAGLNQNTPTNIIVDKFIVTPNLATSEANLSQFAIENPVGNTLNYQTKEAVKQIELYSAEGRLVKTITANNADVSALAKGMYVAKITFKNGQTASKKIIKK